MRPLQGESVEAGGGNAYTTGGNAGEASLGNSLAVPPKVKRNFHSWVYIQGN